MSAQTLARYGRKFTDAERAEYRQQKREQAREQVEQAARALLTSDGWRQWSGSVAVRRS
jgi:hypothetical protein